MGRGQRGGRKIGRKISSQELPSFIIWRGQAGHANKFGFQLVDSDESLEDF